MFIATNSGVVTGDMDDIPGGIVASTPSYDEF